MTLSWDELASHGLMKKLPEKEVVALVMVHLRPMRRKWVKDHGTGEVEKYIMENEIHGKRKLFESPDISFRVATSNHKYGPFNNPSDWYSSSPYDRTNVVPSSY